MHELRLVREVAKVDEKEAEQGAIHSDLVKLGSKDKEDGLLAQRSLAGRLSALWKNLRAKKTQQSKQEEGEDCPIAQARAQSLVGANAPLGWLTFDEMSQAQDSPALAMESRDSGEPKSVESRELSLLSFLKPDPEDDDYMFNEEWFFSPAG